MKPYWENGVVQLYQADAREIPLPDQSVHCVVTSPPYLGLRVYKDNDDRGIGLEASVEAYIANMVDVFREVHRVLRDDGVCWVNLGDSYDAGTNKPHVGSPATDVGGWSGENIHAGNRVTAGIGNRLGIPERVVLALQADGWVWRDTVVWAKKSAMPESLAGWRFERCRVKVAAANQTRAKGKESQEVGAFSGSDNHDMSAEWSDCPGCPKCADNDGLVLRKGSWRTTASHEYIYMLTKGMGYYADGEAVKTARDMNSPFWSTHPQGQRKISRTNRLDGTNEAAPNIWLTELTPATGANRRSVWNDISPEPYGSTRISRRVHVERDAVSGGTKHKVSQDCPEHGDLFGLVPNDEYDARATVLKNRTSHIDGRLAQEPSGDSQTRMSNPGPVLDVDTSDYSDPEGSPFATPSSNQNRRTDHVPETNPPYTPSGGTTPRTGGIPELSMSVENHPGTGESKTSLDVSDVHSLDQTLEGTADISSCCCLFYDIITENSSHFATFPSDLPRICIQASTSEKGCCSECGSQWARVIDSATGGLGNGSWTDHGTGATEGNNKYGGSVAYKTYKVAQTLGWRATCGCNALRCTRCQHVILYKYAKQQTVRQPPTGMPGVSPTIPGAENRESVQPGMYEGALAGSQPAKATEAHPDMPMVPAEFHGAEGQKSLFPEMLPQAPGADHQTDDGGGAAETLSMDRGWEQTPELERGSSQRPSRLHPVEAAEPSDGRQEWVGFGTSVDNGGTLESVAVAGGDSTSPQCDSGRQQVGESSDSDSCETIRDSNLPTLQSNLLGTLSCPNCDGPLTLDAPIILDPFCGTATTCLAAQRLGRRAVGTDISEAYLQQAVKRLEAVTLPMGV